MIFFLLVLLLSPLAHAQEILLGVGQVYSMKVSENSEVRVGKGQIIEVSETTTGINVKALKVGSSTLKVNHHTYHLKVFPSSTLKNKVQIDKILHSMPSLRSQIKKGHVYIVGELQHLDDWEKLAQSGLAYKFAAKISKPIQIEVQLYFSELIKSAHLPLPQIHLYPMVHVTMGGKSPLLTQKIQRFLKNYGLEVHHQASDLEVRPTVRVHVQIAEMNRKWGRQLGITWPGSYSAKIIPKPSQWSSISVALQAMENSGHGQVLASPTLLCRSGGEASFLAGGEFAIRVAGYHTKQVTWKKHGVLLKLKPQADYTGRMQLHVETEVSLIDQSQSIDGIPALKTNRVSTEFDLLNPQTILLSGLIQKTLGRSQNGWPGLRKIPLLGSLFGSTDYQNNQTELVIFLTPEIVYPHSETTSSPLNFKGWKNEFRN